MNISIVIVHKMLLATPTQHWHLMMVSLCSCQEHSLSSWFAHPSCLPAPLSDIIFIMKLVAMGAPVYICTIFICSSVELCRASRPHRMARATFDVHRFLLLLFVRMILWLWFSLL